MAATDAQKRATMKYRKKTYEQINIEVKIGMKDIYKEQAKKRGMSLQAYIQHLVEEDMKKD